MPGFATRAIRAASRVPAAPQPPINVPIYQTSTFEVASAGELAELLEFQRPGHSYSRYSNPTHEALELALSELEGAAACHVTASGMAAIHGAILSTARAGDHVIAPRAMYGGTYALLTDPSAVEAAITDRTRIIWLETIANPTTDMPDIAAISALARTRGIAVMIDNTFASPYLCNPLALGADLVVHSVTKYVGGHSDLTGGAILGDAERVGHARHVVINAGGNAQPFEAFLALRGLKTLALRMERHSETALAVATAMEGAPGIARVRYPGLPSHPQHALAQGQLRGGRGGGMMAIELSGGRSAGEGFLDKLRVAVHATSLGSAETLCSHPASSSHRQLDDAQLAASGLTPGMVRISIGLEDAADLIEDFTSAAA
jgi:cystathionine beta-lyase/cystathionine gamma-synthase